MKMDINYQVEFNFEELNNFEPRENNARLESLTSVRAKWTDEKNF